MLRVVFLGMDLWLLHELRSCHVYLAGAYLPRAPYHLHRLISPLLKQHPKMIKKLFGKAGVYQGLADYLAEHGITTLKEKAVNSSRFFRVLRRVRPDLGVVANFGQILSKELLGIPQRGFINFHPSLLPRFRGPAPLGHMLLKNETRAGVTWHCMTPEPDRGDILAQESFDIEPNDSVKSLDQKARAAGARLIGPLLRDIEAGKTTPVPQNEAEASYYPKLTEDQKQRLAAMGKKSAPYRIQGTS